MRNLSYVWLSALLTFLAACQSAPDKTASPPDFSLHKDYTHAQDRIAAVRYELLTENAEVPCKPEREEGESQADYQTRAEGAPSGCSQEFLHLLGPDTLRPALRLLQCPVPAKRRRLVHAAAEGCVHTEESLQVDYNAYGFLALREFNGNEALGAVHPSHSASATVYDLRTGRALKLADIIRSGADTALSRLITHHLEQDEDITSDDFLTLSKAAPLPRNGLGMVEAGLVFQYTTYELVAYVYGMPAVTVPYAELLPLLRPNSPVAHMLRERGLWKQQKSR